MGAPSLQVYSLTHNYDLWNIVVYEIGSLKNIRGTLLYTSQGGNEIWVKKKV